MHSVDFFRTFDKTSDLVSSFLKCNGLLRRHFCSWENPMLWSNQLIVVFRNCLKTNIWYNKLNTVAVHPQNLFFSSDYGQCFEFGKYDSSFYIELVNICQRLVNMRPYSIATDTIISLSILPIHVLFVRSICQFSGGNFI